MGMDCGKCHRRIQQCKCDLTGFIEGRIPPKVGSYLTRCIDNGGNIWEEYQYFNGDIWDSERKEIVFGGQPPVIIDGLVTRFKERKL